MVLRKYHKTVPEVVDFYNSTKDGVDSLDLMAHSMTTKRQTKRWPIVVFFNILDMASVASNVIFKIKFPEHKLSNHDNRRLFQLDIAMSFFFASTNRETKTVEQLAQTADYIDGPCLGHHRTKSATSHASCTCLCSQEKEMCQMSIEGRQEDTRGLLQTRSPYLQRPHCILF
ncbi:hypothetical protein RRG08_061653 [Elysia crispata]|uniref:PiggyBac transposable element-derived protein domain-containing protein n=1 Tax=Elysia crispata TaxID=231223 RepID=A0AAE1E0A5_9GAST|nr:hypothetical protein RRG08_061653 [Elysia crispata]